LPAALSSDEIVLELGCTTCGLR